MQVERVKRAKALAAAYAGVPLESVSLVGGVLEKFEALYFSSPTFKPSTDSRCTL